MLLEATETVKVKWNTSYNLEPSENQLSRTWSVSICSLTFLVNAVLEWNGGLVPGWEVPWCSFIHRVELSEVLKVEDLDFLELEEGVENSVVELTEEGEGVSARQVLLLGVINASLNFHVWLIGILNRVWHLLQEFVIWCALKLLLELSELARFVQLLRSVWVQVTQVVEVLGAERLSSSIAHVLSAKRVVDDLNSFPVTLGLQEFIHDLFGALIAVRHNPSVETDQPNLL